MNPVQRSLSNLGMSKSRKQYLYQDYIDQSRTSSAFYRKEEPSRLDLQLARYEEFKRNYKQQSYYPSNMNRSFVEERYTNQKEHLQTQPPIRVEVNYTVPSRKNVVVSDTAAYLKERDQIMDSFMSAQEIERIKRVYYRR